VKKTLVEFVHICVHDGQEEFLASRPDAVAAAIPGFASAPVVAEREDGTWTDVRDLRRRRTGRGGRREGRRHAGVGRMAAVGEVVSIDMAWMPVA
jgi:hypothetical protein